MYQRIRRHTIDNIEIQSRLVYLPSLSKEQKLRARELRKNGILSEVVFWNCVRNGGFHGVNFDRQRSIGRYFVDFYIPDYGVVIELDGISHDNKQDYDRIRDEYLHSLDLIVLRFQSRLIFEDINAVLSYIEKILIENFRV